MRDSKREGGRVKGRESMRKGKMGGGSKGKREGAIRR